MAQPHRQPAKPQPGDSTTGGPGGPAPARPVTVLAIRRARPGREREFEAFLGRLREAFLASPGNLGMSGLPPTGSDRDYDVVYRYDSADSSRAWHERTSAPR